MHKTDSTELSLAPGLYLVATPIGNLGDITLRALDVLKRVDRIACEDTRQTQKLLNHFQIPTPTVSCHQHNEHQRTHELLTALQAGQRIAFVSDAGMPGISDPGAWLAAEAIAIGLPVIPIPGANAALSALVASGLPTGEFQFLGFLPEKAGARRSRIEDLAAEIKTPRTLIFYEAPHRIVETLADLELFDDRQRFQIEHGDGAIAAIGRKAVTSLGGDARAMHARRVRNVAEHFAGGAFDHHHVSATRNEHAPRGGFGGDIVSASVALDIELLNFERLRAANAGRGKADCEENRKRGQ